MHLKKCLLPVEIDSEEPECSDCSLTESFEVDVIKASNSLDDSVQFEEGVLSNSTPKKALSGDKTPTSTLAPLSTTPMQDSPPTGDCISLRSSKPAAPLTRIKRRKIMQLNKEN